MPQLRPMKPVNAPENLSALPFPLWASTKLDGIRCIIKDGVAYSNTLKPIRNRYVQAKLSDPRLNGLDGELIVGNPNAWDCMRKTNSGIMSYDGEPDFRFHVFDHWNRPGIKYIEAYEELCRFKYPWVEVIEQDRVTSVKELEAYEQAILDEGYEGVILRRPDGMYKYGRSTLREGFLIRLKRFNQAEAIVVGVTALQRNLNEPELNELGYTHRSAAQDGKVAMELLGALVVQGEFNGVLTEFEIGTGFTLSEREWLWEHQADQIGRVVTYKFFPSGSKERPRHTSFISFRDLTDL